MRQGDVTVGEWKLDGDANDASPSRRTSDVRGNPGLGPGQTDVPDLADLLNGIDDHVRRSGAAMNTTRSLSVVAWDCPDKLGSRSTTVSHGGVFVNEFSIGAGGDGSRHLFAAMADQSGTSPHGDWITAANFQYGVWSHLARAYSRERRVIELFVNGVLIGLRAHTAVVEATGAWADRPAEIGSAASWDMSTASSCDPFGPRCGVPSSLFYSFWS